MAPRSRTFAEPRPHRERGRDDGCGSGGAADRPQHDAERAELGRRPPSAEHAAQDDAERDAQAADEQRRLLIGPVYLDHDLGEHLGRQRVAPLGARRTVGNRGLERGCIVFWHGGSFCEGHPLTPKVRVNDVPSARSTR